MVVSNRCVLLAGKNPLLAEGIRGLLQPVIGSVVMVADRGSLLENVGRLVPALAIIDLAMGRGDIKGLIDRLRTVCPGLKVLVFGMYDEASVAESLARAGADRFVVTSSIATDLLPAVLAVLGNGDPESVGPVVDSVAQEGR
jgi:DNA-binding NarL/FixJ family response regulator